MSAAAIEELEQRFFAEGLSEASMLAASEREAEREQPSDLGSKLLLGGALCAALAVMATGTLLRNADGRPLDLPRAAVVRIVSEPAPPPPPVHAQASAGPVGAPTAPSSAAAVAMLPQVSQDPQAACAQMLRRGRFREINDRCAAAFATAPSAALAARVAELALERGRNGDAAIWARRAIHQNPRHALAFVYLGGAEQELGHADAARAAFSRYLDLEPEGQHADDVRSILASLEE